MRTASEILAEDPAPAAAASEILEELQAAANRPKITTGGRSDARQLRHRCQGGEIPEGGKLPKFCPRK